MQCVGTPLLGPLSGTRGQTIQVSPSDFGSLLLFLGLQQKSVRKTVSGQCRVREQVLSQTRSFLFKAMSQRRQSTQLLSAEGPLAVQQSTSGPACRTSTPP